jgi:hypothetical protein
VKIDQANGWKAAMAADEEQRAECVAARQEEEQRQREQVCRIVNHHFRHPDIAYSFRHLSYWEIPGSPLELVLRNVKGKKRREMIRDFYEQGRLDQLVPVLAADELSDEDRERLGAIHPSFMGGEYLPGYCRDEVENARIELDSTTSDVISLRARPIGRTRPRIAYTLRDEYETEYKIRPARTARPLTLGQLFTLLDDVDTDVTDRGWLRHGWVLSLNESNRTLDNGDPRTPPGLHPVSSEFYPELTAAWHGQGLLVNLGEQCFKTLVRGTKEPKNRGTRRVSFS